MSDIQTFVFLDLETTGMPHLENYKTKITELCLIAIESSQIQSCVYPSRVKNKLNLCFNPQKMISTNAQSKTGLSNEILENQAPFSDVTVTLIKSFIAQLRQPVCFVAHSGKRFGYPILQAEIQNCDDLLSDDILCIDSLEAFRYLHKVQEVAQAQNAIQGANSTEDGGDDVPTNLQDNLASSEPSRKKMKLMKPKFSLKDVYKRLTNKDPVNSHDEAEAKVDMLIHCAATLGSRFVDWANQKRIKFNSVDKMEKKVR